SPTPQTVPPAPQQCRTLVSEIERRTLEVLVRRLRADPFQSTLRSIASRVPVNARDTHRPSFLEEATARIEGLPNFVFANMMSGGRFVLECGIALRHCLCRPPKGHSRALRSVSVPRSLVRRIYLDRSLVCSDQRSGARSSGQGQLPTCFGT